MTKDLKRFFRERKEKKIIENLKIVFASFGFLVFWYIVAIIFNLSY
jgi:hypothetical protein